MNEWMNEKLNADGKTELEKNGFTWTVTKKEKIRGNNFIKLPYTQTDGFSYC